MGDLDGFSSEVEYFLQYDYLVKKWDMLEFINDLHHIVSYENLSDKQKLDSLQ